MASRIFQSYSWPDGRLVPSESPYTAAMLQADTAFLAKLTARLDNRLTTTSNRMWVAREELRNLRRLAGMKTSSAALKNRRMRVATIKQFLAQAEENVMQRAAELVTQKLKPPPQPLRSWFDVVSP